MKKCAVIFMMVPLVLWISPTFAGDLSFPTTEDEIVKALSLKDGKTVYEGVTYESEKGRVYKVIDGKRYRLRGLQVVVIVESGIVPRAGALIHFDFNSAKVRSESYPLIDEFGKALKGDLIGATVILAGRTGSKRSVKYNQNLSEERARTVANYLSAYHGIAADRMVVKGYGEMKPIVQNETEKGRLTNRRVEFIRIE